MKNYKVIKKEGIRTCAGKLIKQGKIFQAAPSSAMIKLQLRCEEIKEVEERGKTDPPPQPSLKQVKEALTKNGVRFASNTAEKKLRELFDELDAE